MAARWFDFEHRLRFKIFASREEFQASGQAGQSVSEVVLEVYQNPHPALSHNKMWERV